MGGPGLDVLHVHQAAGIDARRQSQSRRCQMADALSETTIELVKKTVPALEAQGTAVTDRMYEILFRNPDIRDLFNQSHHGETVAQGRFKWSSQHGLCDWIGGTGPEPRQVFSSRAS